MDFYVVNKFYSSGAVLFEFLTNLSSVNWLALEREKNFDYPALLKAIDFNMNDGWTFGTLEASTMNIIIFYIGGPDLMKDSRTVAILYYITPVLAEAYTSVLNRSFSSFSQLSERRWRC